MKINRVMLLVLALLGVTLVQSAQAFYNPSTGRWLSRDPLGEAGFEVVATNHRKATSDGPNRYTFVHNNPIALVDYLGLRSKGAGAGQLCVDKNCKAKDLESLRYLTEDDSTKLQKLPAPGNCADADALYAPGWAWKIPDNGTITIVCDKEGCITNIKYSKWPWWVGSGPIWEVGQPKPKKWPGDIEPYPNDPPQ